MPAYELLGKDGGGNNEVIAIFICDLLVVSDDESRAQAESFLERRFGEETKERWLQGGAKIHIV
jgi:hypothetical protein